MELEKVKVLEVKEVTFNGVSLLAVKTDKGIFASIKNFCDDLGLASNKQIDKIKKNPVLQKGYTVLVLATTGGYQSVSCIDTDYLPLWLSGISIKHCKIEIQPLLLDFQLKAQKVLANAFVQKSEPKQEQKIYTQAELILMQAEMLVSLEKTNKILLEKAEKLETKTDGIETKIIQFENIQRKNNEELWKIEEPSCIPLQKTERAKIVELIRAYAGATYSSYQDLYTKLYAEFTLRYSIDLKTRAKNQKNKNPLDIAEEIFVVDKLFAVAWDLFNPKKIKELIDVTSNCV